MRAHREEEANQTGHIMSPTSAEVASLLQEADWMAGWQKERERERVGDVTFRTLGWMYKGRNPIVRAQGSGGGGSETPESAFEFT